jgi:hypothetical protein
VRGPAGPQGPEGAAGPPLDPGAAVPLVVDRLRDDPDQLGMYVRADAADTKAGDLTMNGGDLVFANGAARTRLQMGDGDIAGARTVAFAGADRGLAWQGQRSAVKVGAVGGAADWLQAGGGAGVQLQGPVRATGAVSAPSVTADQVAGQNATFSARVRAAELSGNGAAAVSVVSDFAVGKNVLLGAATTFVGILRAGSLQATGGITAAGSVVAGANVQSGANGQVRAGTGGLWVNGVQVFDGAANLRRPPTYGCAPNQVMVGADAQGRALCRTVDCPPGNAFRGFAANGAPLCERDDTGNVALPANNCPAGAAIGSIAANGATVCRAVHAGDRSCPAGQFVKRIHANGDITCSAPDASAMVPRGAVVAFNAASCPSGWSPADGRSSRPDLRGRFPIGINGSGAAHSARVGLRSAGGAHNFRIWVLQNEFDCCSGDDGIVGVSFQWDDGAESEQRGSNDSWSWRAGSWRRHLPPHAGVLWCVKN